MEVPLHSFARGLLAPKLPVPARRRQGAAAGDVPVFRRRLSRARRCLVGPTRPAVFVLGGRADCKHGVGSEHGVDTQDQYDICEHDQFHAYSWWHSIA